jgi:HD-like signal output (HDOD) protein
MFQGDIAQFAAADLLLFLSHMNKEGVLSVRQAEAVLSLSFRRNLLVDATCEAAEELVLEDLARRQAADGQTLAHLRQAREETGLPLSRILDDVTWLSVDEAALAVTAGIRETVFRLLLWESGEFHFTEIPIDDNPVRTPLDAQALVMDLTREVDEYRELLRRIGPLKCPVHAVAGAPLSHETSAEERYVLTHATTAPTAEDLLSSAPFPCLATAQAVALALENGRLEFSESAPAVAGAVGPEADLDGVLPDYLQAMRRLDQADDDEARVREILDFARTHCTQSILFGVASGHIKRATVYRHDTTGRLAAIDHRAPQIDLASDLVFHQALVAGRSFVGKVFPSPVIEALKAEIPAVDCGLLPLGRLGDLDLLLYAVTTEASLSQGPLASLDRLAKQLHTPQASGVTKPAEASLDSETDNALSLLDDNSDAAEEMVASIRDLPPMPNSVGRVLALLANLDCDMKELVDVLSCDPAIVAQVIKVSNSSLFGGRQEIGSINLAITRLGLRTIRSVVVAASTRNLFPMDSSRKGLLGRVLWEHSVQTGLAGRRVAEFTGCADPDEAFAAGVLHDIGKVILLLNKPDEFILVQQQLEKGATESVAAERKVLGFDHCLVGDRLLDNWGMPPSLRSVARWHHQPEMAGPLAPLVQVVTCADLLCQKLGGHSGSPVRLAERLAKARTALNLDDTSFADLENLLKADLEQDTLFG